MLDTVFNLSNDAHLQGQTENRPIRRKILLSQSDEIDEDKIVQQDVLLWGVCSRSASSTFKATLTQTWSKRHILLYPNRIEMPGDQCLMPIDELLSVENKEIKDQKVIHLKSANREMSINFAWKFEMAQWYHDILRVWKNVNRLSKNAPKQLSFRRSLKDEAKRQEKVVQAQKKILGGMSSLDIATITEKA